MSGGFFTKYAKESMPPEIRAELFAKNEPRLTWTSLLFSDFPNADMYLVGGTLRDAMLGHLPKDIDIVVRNIKPDTLEAWLQRHGAVHFVGTRFGTFKFTPHGFGGEEPIDIAFPRVEEIGNEHYSGRKDLRVLFDYRLPIKKDLARRDFTMNAIAYDIRRRHLIDPFDGLADIENGVIRAVGDASERFLEDATRMLRALRFSSQLGFAVEESTWHAIKDFVHILNTTRPGDDGSHVYAIAREVIGKEFLLGFSKHPVHTLHLWQDCGALELFLPEISRLSDIELPSGKNAFETTERVLHLLMKKDFVREHGKKHASTTLLAAALFVFVDDDHVKEGAEVCKRLFFHQFATNHHAYVNCKRLFWLLSHARHLDHEDPASIPPHQFEKRFCTERGEELLLLIHAMCIAEGEHSIARERLHIARRLKEEMNRICPEGKFPELISGSEIKELGVPEGPIYRTLKNNIRDAQLRGTISTKEEALDLLRVLVRQI